MHILNLLDQGPLDYMLVDTIQRRLNREVGKLSHPDTFIAWEACDTYTAGRRTKPEDIPDRSVPVIQMDRGGSVTYHGPGQLVLYPIVKVQAPHDVVAFVRNTEKAIIRALEKFAIYGVQIPGRSGVWICQDGKQDEKICAIGIKFAHETSMHGLAFNVNTNLAKFLEVIPCGITDAGVTSLQAQGMQTSLADVLPILAAELNRSYSQFLLLARKQTELIQLDPSPYLAQAWKDLASNDLPAKTGVAWKPKQEEEK
ncbi:lipoyl(octanoyl) transferase LipB [Arcanobacterium hippocoleae]|uniref:Octanoyltransferase n=1 Tax=Arcanobacterium hippocoleae TaxID=149017 RepID=A0ABU1T3G7_9ACTO|nr:lipoyl(octanoyl) transferase LipB [Arcanobacterium hippocoleae]MDR6939940.1 lipoyl(octanoyl) transferase [Arcanobacterium hippocoleae]